MTLREAMRRTRLTYRPFAKRLNISATSISRLVNYGEYPTRLGEGEVRRRMAEVFETAGIGRAEISWPDAGIRPGCNGRTRARRTGAAVATHEPRGLEEISTKEVDLMQLNRNVLALFGLRVNPFLNDVEADEDVFRFKGYDLVDTAIRDAIEQRGFVAVCGESGSGKTTIWDGIEAAYGQRDDTVICRPQVKSKETITPEHLARCLIYGLSGEQVKIKNNAEDRGRQLSAALRDVRSGLNDRKVVLLIDDAHFCSGSVLRQLKTFFEEKIGRYRLMTIVLIGIPEMKAKLARFPEVGNRIRLVEVPPVPVREYLEFKLRRVGASVDRLFDPQGFDAFCDRFRSGGKRAPAIGRPLLINSACIRAMVALSLNGGEQGEKITPALIDQLPGEESARRCA